MAPDMGLTVARRVELFRDRWSSFDENSGVVRVSDKLAAADLKVLPVLADFDDRLLEMISADVSVATWKAGAVLFEEGTYIDLAFLVVKGRVDLYLSDPGNAAAPIFDATRTVISPAASAPLLPATTRAPAGEPVFLSTMDFDLPRGGAISLGEGEIFGEIGALSGWPQSVTARTAGECTLLQIRLPALRLMRQRSKAFKEQLDRVYRERSLLAHLKQSPLLSSCTDGVIHKLAERVSLVSFGPGDVIAEQSDPVPGLYIIRSGFIRLVQNVGAGSVTVSYLSKGASLGEAELLLPDVNGWLCGARSQQYSELVLIPREDVFSLLGPDQGVEDRLWDVVSGRVKEVGLVRRDLHRSRFLNEALERGLVEGTSVLAIDLNVCTRCDDCVRGCAATHGGIPRFVREGNRVENLLVTRSCYHCQDPVCLVGCPTGAIRRSGTGAVVEIDDRLCIGCSSCANNCPYGAIVMHETGTTWAPNTIPAALRGQPRLLATKCDLCYTDPLGPACVRSCPHGCAVRIGSVSGFQDFVKDGA